MLGLLLLGGGKAWAQDEVPEGWSFGGWEFFEINHNFKNTPIFGSFYFEHDNLQYAIPDTRWKPYLAIEVFTWDTWKRTRHYVACTYDVTSWMELEAYYFYYTHNGKPAQHIIGVGVNFYL